MPDGRRVEATATAGDGPPPTSGSDAARAGDARPRADHAFPTTVVVGALVVGLALRIAWWLVAQPEPVADYLGYRSMAERLASDGTYIRDGVPTAWRVPGYPGFLALGMLISRSDGWLSFLNVLISSTVVPLTGLVAHRLRLPTRAVAVAAAVAAVLPPLVLWAPVLGSENLQLPLLLAAVALALDPAGTRRARIASGLLFGAAVLVRPESLVYLAAAPVLLWSTGGTLRAALRRALPIGVAAACVVAPWYLRNELVVGRGVGLSSTGGMNFYLAHRDDGYGFVDPAQTPLRGLAEDELAETGYRLGLEHLAEAPWSLAGDVARGTIELYAPPEYAAHYSTRARGRYPFPPSVSPAVEDGARTIAVVGWVGFALVALAGVVRLRTRPRALAAIGALVLANWLCFAVVFWAMPRYRFTIEPLVCIAVGAALGVARPARQEPEVTIDLRADAKHRGQAAAVAR